MTPYWQGFWFGVTATIGAWAVITALWVAYIVSLPGPRAADDEDEGGY